MAKYGTDFLPPEQRSELMRRVRSTGTSAELALVEALVRELGPAAPPYDLNCGDLPGKPDVVFRSERLAIFVDGEYWHGGQWIKRGLTSLGEQFPDAEKRRKWMKKIQGNCRRDLANTAKLLEAGWTVLRFWEGEIQQELERVIPLIKQALRQRAPRSPASAIPAQQVAEFFAGIGLAHLGLQPDGWKIGFANDHAPDKVLFYRHNFAEAGAYLDERDVHEVKPGDLPKISLATASFPCTDLSLAGAQKGLIDGKQSSAYLHFIELITQLGKNRPPLVLLENVVGMITSRRGRDLELCLTLLQKAGYTVDVFVLDARHFVPQSRPRLFVVGLRSDLQPAGHLGDAEALRAHSPILRPQALMDFVAQHPNLPWSLRPLPAPVQTRRSLAEVLEQLPPRDPRWWSAERAARLYAQMSPAHQEMVQVMMRAQEPRYGTVFRRMRQGRSMAEIRTDGLAGCLRTPKGGSARQILVQASRGEYAVRLLTARECARLMGADDYAFPEGMSENKALFAFGDGVCVKAVQWISEHYLMPVATELIRGRVLRGS